MTLVESIIMALVIGLVVIVGAITIIQKIYDENRKNAEYASKKLITVIQEMPKMMTEFVKNLEQQKENKYKYQKKELDEEMEQLFNKENS